MKSVRLTCVLLFFYFALPLAAQERLRVSGPQSGFPVAVPRLCDAGEGRGADVKVADIISRNLTISGLFNVLAAGSFVEEPGKCNEKLVYSDWTVTGAEGLVKGVVRENPEDSDQMIIELYLYDIAGKNLVVGKRYMSTRKDIVHVAHRFSNEIVRFFTGTPGIFGTKIAYVGKVGRFKELFVMDLDGSGIRQLTTSKGLIVSPDWTNDGKRIIYTSYKSKMPDLYEMSAFGSTEKRITNNRALEMGAHYIKSSRSNRSGLILASSTDGGNSNIVYLNESGEIISKLTDSPYIDISPSMSPDGDQVVFCSNRGGGPQIYVINADGGPAKRISFTESRYCTSPSWSPDGKNIAFVCRSNGYQIFIVSPSGTTDPVQLTFGGMNEDPSWSPDSRYLIFSSDFGRGGAENLAMMNVTTGRIVQLTRSKSSLGQPSWSPILHY